MASAIDDLEAMVPNVDVSRDLEQLVPKNDPVLDGLEALVPQQASPATVTSTPSVSTDTPTSTLEVPPNFSESLKIDQLSTPNPEDSIFPEHKERSLWETLNTPILKLVPKLSQDEAGALQRWTDVSGLGGIVRSVLGNEKSDQLAQVGEHAVADLANYFTSPLGLGTLGIGVLPNAAQKAVGAAFATHALLMGAPENVRKFKQAKTFKAKAEAAVGLLENAAIGAAGIPAVKSAVGSAAAAMKSSAARAQTVAPATAAAVNAQADALLAAEQQAAQRAPAPAPAPTVEAPVQAEVSTPALETPAKETAKEASTIPSTEIPTVQSETAVAPELAVDVTPAPKTAPLQPDAPARQRLSQWLDELERLVAEEPEPKTENATPEEKVPESVREEPQNRAEIGKTEEASTRDSLQRPAEGEAVVLDETPTQAITENEPPKSADETSPESPAGPSEPTRTDATEPVAEVKSRDDLLVDAYEYAEAVGRRVAQGQSDSIIERAVMAAYDNARSSIERTGKYNPKFMRAAAMRAAGREAGKAGETLNVAAEEGSSETRLDRLPSTEKLPDETAAESEAIESVELLMKGLSERERKILEGHAMHGDTFEELAKVFGISKQRVKQIYDDAREKVRSRYVESRAGTTEARGTPMSEVEIRSLLETQHGLDPNKITFTNDPQSQRQAALHVYPGGGRRLEINVAKIDSPERLDRVVREELAHAFSEERGGANRQLVERLIAKLTPEERTRIEDDIHRGGYLPAEVPFERSAQGLQKLADTWRDRPWFEQLVGQVMAWGSKIGLPLTRLAAERLAAQAVVDGVRILNAAPTPAGKPTGTRESSNSPFSWYGEITHVLRGARGKRAMELYGTEGKESALTVIKEAGVEWTFTDDRDPLIEIVAPNGKVFNDGLSSRLADSWEDAEQQVSNSLPLLDEVPDVFESRQDFVQSVGRRAVGEALAAMREAEKEGASEADVLERGMALLRDKPGFHEEQAREFFGPEQPKTPEPEVTGIRNAIVDEQRSKRGLEPREAPLHREFGTVWDEATQAFSEDRDVGRDLVKSLERNIRPLTDVEDAILTREQLIRQNAFDAAMKRVNSSLDDPAVLAEAKAKLAESRDALYEVYDVGQRAGTANARGLNARKLLIAQDYTLARMENRMRAAQDGKPLSEEQAATIKQQADQIAELQKRLEAQQPKQEDAQLASYFDRLLEETRSDASKTATQGRSARDFFNEQAEKARARKRERGARTTAGLDPLELLDDAIIGASHIANGLSTLTAMGKRWVSKMVEELGEGIRPHLPEIFQRSKEYHQANFKTFRKTPVPEKPEAIVERAKATAEAGEPLDKNLITQLIRAHVKAGLTELDPVMQAVTKDLKTAYPDVTERQVRDAFSGYGKATFPSRDQIDMKMAELHRAGQLASAIEDALAGEAPKKSGPQRNKPTQTVREMQKELQEIMRRNGIETTSPEQQLASVNQARATSLRNQIEDLDKRLRTGEKPTEKTSVPASPEVETLRAERDAMRNELDLLEAGPIKTADQIANQRYKTAITKRIGDLKKKLSAGDFSKPTKNQTALNQENIALKAELDTIKSEFNRGVFEEELKNRSAPRKIYENVRDTINTARAIQTSFDLSAVLRQGGFIALGHPIRAVRAIPAMLKALRSEQKQHEVNAEILSRPNTSLYKDSKLYLHDPNDPHLYKMEEAYMSRWAAKIPLVGASERAYTTFLNRLRADSFDAMKSTLGRNGLVTMDEAKAISNYINVATGRGNLGATAGKGSVGLNALFFSPRYVMSRFELLAGQPLWKGTARTRFLVAQEYARYLAGVGLVLSLGLSGGGTLETDPRSSDFGKLKFGNTRLDPLSGLSQVTVLESRLGTGETKTGKGKIVPIRGEHVPYGSPNAADITFHFVRSKLAPLPSGILDVATGSNVVGQPATLASTLQRNIIPLSFGDVANAMEDQGVPRGTVLATLALLGMSVQTYDSAKKPVRSAAR